MKKRKTAKRSKPKATKPKLYLVSGRLRGTEGYSGRAFKYKEDADKYVQYLTKQGYVDIKVKSQ